MVSLGMFMLGVVIVVTPGIYLLRPWNLRCFEWDILPIRKITIGIYHCPYPLLATLFLPFFAVLNAPGSPHHSKNRYRHKYGNQNNGYLLKKAK
jgi:hypothetical protein